MRTVMQKAQELADAIVASDVYLRMKELEEAVQQDPAAEKAVNDLMKKRQRVEALLMEKGMDPSALRQANAEMAEAEKVMNANEKVAALKAGRKAFSTMMENVNRVLRLVITGEVREDDVAPGCSGSCDGCNGCG
ncbi:MAG: YlbF family regulator [Clostridia bacterium]|nr:YlbF family regulator [Clostridia bacterium]